MKNSFTTESKARLLDLLGRQQGLFAEILAVTEKYTGLISADEAEELDESIQVRQDIIGKIKGLHQESDPLMQSYISFSKSKEGKSIPEIDSAAKRLRETIAECARLNDISIAAAKEKLEEYSKDGDLKRKSRESIGLYIQGLTNAPRHFDKMS